MPAKRQSHHDALRELLSDGRPHSMSECLKVGGFRYGARIHDMRHDEGLNIVTTRVGDDEFEYQLVQPIEPKQLAMV